MARIDDALASVENTDVLTKILLQTGAFHRKLPGFEPAMFWVSQLLTVRPSLLLSCDTYKIVYFIKIIDAYKIPKTTKEI